MKIFGFEIGNTKLEAPVVVDDSAFELVRRDQSPAIRPEIKMLSIPDNKQPANIKPVKPRTLSYNTGNLRRGQFSEPEYDLDIIGRVEDTDSYVMQAHVKKSGLMFKEGYEFVGPNPKTVNYINLRFQQIARATGIPCDDLLKAIGSGLIKKSNVLLVKVRKEEASGGRTRVIPGEKRELQPIAGYFVAPAETMQFDSDEYGRIRRWKQEMPDGSSREFRPEDVAHFYWNRKEGMTFGTPSLVPVLDDIRALRKIEENIELLVYQHLFPLFHYQVGTDDLPASIDEYGNDEIEIARREIQYMPSEGGIVTSHRHNVSLIGAENRSLRAEGYVDHFKKRVFAGLGISAVDMGEGECYDEHTQTLTEDGWKFHWQIDHDNEKIGTYNPLSRRIEFHIANHKYEAPYVGEMIHFKNKLVDIMVTPSHDMWVWHDQKHTWSKMSAADVQKGKAGTNCMFMETAPFLDQEEVEEVSEELKNLAVLGGLAAAKGCLSSPLAGAADDSIDIYGVKNAQQYIPTFNALGLQWSVGSTKRGRSDVSVDVSVHASFFRELFSNLLPTVKSLPLVARKLFVRTYVENSFSKMSGGGFNGTTTDTRDRDQTQELVMSAGYRCHTQKKTSDLLGEHYYMSISLTEKNILARKVNIKTDIETVPYGGIIYCYNVPNHLFVTRRNGRVTIQGNTANRATSDNMSRNLVDSVKDIQRHVESQFTEFVINELLLESTFGSEVLNLENRVYLKFREIDLEHQIKKEAHYADQFSKNTISLNEARIGTGRQAVEIPTAEEIESGQDLSQRYPEWHAFQWKLIEEPKTMIQSIDEPYSPAAKAAAASASTSVTEQQRVEAGQEQEDREVRMERERAKAKPAPAAKSKDSLRRKFNLLQGDLETLIRNGGFDPHWFRQMAYTAETLMFNELKSSSMSAFAEGYRTVNPNKELLIDASIRSRSKIEARVNFYIHRLIDNTIQAVDRQGIDVLENDDKIHRVKAVFDALKYRNDFIEDVEIRKARNLGMLEAARDLGYSHFRLIVDTDSCETCQAAANDIFIIGDMIDLESIPPLHANSRTRIEFLEV